MIGVFVARFQPLHKSHEFLIRKSMEENDKTYVFNYSIIEKEKTTDDILKEWIGNSSSVEF